MQISVFVALDLKTNKIISQIRKKQKEIEIDLKRHLIDKDEKYSDYKIKKAKLIL